MIDLSVFDMTEDLLATNINVEEKVKTIESSTVGCGVEVSGKQVQSLKEKIVINDYATTTKTVYNDSFSIENKSL